MLAAAFCAACRAVPEQSVARSSDPKLAMDVPREASDTAPTLGLPNTIDVDLPGGGRQSSVSHSFASPLDGRHIQFRIRVRLPGAWAVNPPSSVQVTARDTRNRWQSTDRIKGLIGPGNQALVREGQSYVLTMVYRPTPMTYAMEGLAPIGFNPDWSSGGGIEEIVLTFATADKASPDSRMRGRAEVLEQRIEPAVPDTRPEHATITPVMRRDRNPASFVQPIATQQLGSGAARYFSYGDIGPKYDGARVDAYLATLERSQHRFFRLIPAFDLEGNFSIGTAEYAAMDKLVASATAHHITLILTLFNGTIERPALREPMRSDAERRKFLETLRPFVQKYRSEIQSGRVIISAVNELQGFGGVTERQKQALVEGIDRLVIEEAPGATLIVGDVVRFDDLAYYLHIPALFKGQPAKFIIATHLWAPEDSLPDADRLNLPESGNIIGVWITEHSAKDGYSWVASVARKGYQVALVWTDADYPYDSALHRAALGVPTVGR